MLDNLTAAQRHLILQALAGALVWLSTNLDAMGLPSLARAVLAIAVAAALSWVTPLTRQYGTGSTIPGEVDPVEDFDPASTDAGLVIEDH